MSRQPILIAPSILAADFARLGDQVKAAEAAGADWIHIDVMDGRFVPNITMGPLVVEALSGVTSLPLDAHLMIVEPERYIRRFADAGAASISVHVEACVHLHSALAQIRDSGCRAGVALNPHTPPSAIAEILDTTDLINVMTVNPGFGGQRFIKSTLDKTRRLREMVKARGLPIRIQVDGGINPAYRRWRSSRGSGCHDRRHLRLRARGWHRGWHRGLAPVNRGLVWLMSRCRGRKAIDGGDLKRALDAAVSDFPRHIDGINRMNVFPVPDGDTGTNMAHTLSRAWREIADVDAGAAVIAERFAYGALMGARGNSGVILSQLLKGFADGLRGNATLDAPLLNRACADAATLAYAAVAEPTEGTILTVARDAADALDQGMRDDLPLDDALRILIGAAEESLERTPSLLPILRRAGVLDAGGMGLLCFLRGLLANAATDHEPRALAESSMPVISAEDRQFGYDVQFLLLGEALDIDAVRRDLSDMGDSLLVVGDSETLKVHIHVPNPAMPLDYAVRSGAMLDDIVVENMDLQRQRGQIAAESPAALAVIAVASGDGLKALFRELGCSGIVDGGQTANPGVEDLLREIRQADATRIALLPNNRNIALAAAQAASMATDVDARVVATQTPLQGISAMMAMANALDAGAAFDGVIDAMTAACGRVRSIEIAMATRDATLPKLSVTKGEYMALVDGEAIAAAACLERAVIACFAGLDLGGYELATLIYGDELAETAARALIRRLSIDFGALEYELVYGGQALYPLLIGLE